jgi:hypothetical protein
MKAKTFDSVELMHRGAEKIRNQTSSMTKDQELEFWRERSKNLKHRQETALRRHTRSKREAERGPERGTQR